MQRYVTKGVQEQVPVQLQILMWQLIDDLPKERDYLQIFNFEKMVYKIMVTHSQEVPEYEQTYAVSGPFLFVGKIFVIQEDDHETMLLAEEY